MNEHLQALRPRTAEELMHHPGFPLARRIHCEEHLALFADLHFNRTYMAMARNVLFSVLMCLHAGYKAGDQQSRPTIGTILDFSDKIGLGSRRMAEDFVARLKHIGFVREVPAPGDRRVKLLEPTESMIEHDRRYSAALFNALTALPPTPHYSRRMGDDPTFHLAQRRVGLANINYTPDIIGRNEAMFRLFNRDAAYGLVCWAVAEAENGAPLRLSFAELGRHFSVSRTHIRELVAELASAGLVRVTGSGRDRLLEVCPLLYSVFDTLLADVLAAQDRLAWLVYRGRLTEFE